MEDRINGTNEVAGATPKVPAPKLQSNIPIPIQNDGISRNLSKLDLTTEEGMTKFNAFALQYIRSNKSGLATKEDVLSIFCRAQDLGLPFTSCAEHIHVINGKTGVDIHIIKALLLRAACHWECLKDYQALYEYTDGFNVFNENALPEYCVKCKNAEEAELLSKDNSNEKVYVYPVRYYKDFNGNIYKDYQLNSKQFQVVIAKSQVAEVAKSGKIAVYRIPSVPIDYITQYKIYRTVNGVETFSIGSFTYSEALAAGLFDKDTYKKYPRILISHRAFTLAARDIGSDLLFGCMETTELKIVNGYDIDEQDIIETTLVTEPSNEA